MNIKKYFWDLNETALKETKKILTRPMHPQFAGRLITILSRCQQPKELFSLISQDTFVRVWPGVRSRWIKIARESDFRDWWQSIYEQIIQRQHLKKARSPKGSPAHIFLNIGTLIRKTRLDKGWSQNELALRTGMKQPDISLIEEGKKNITLSTLARLYKVLGIKKIELE